MEMMIVLLIVAIVAAASAPLVSKKMTSDMAGSSGGFWSRVGDDNSIGYNLSGNSRSVLIGASKVPDGSSPKLYIESSGNEAQIGFGRR